MFFIFKMKNNGIHNVLCVNFVDLTSALQVLFFKFFLKVYAPSFSEIDKNLGLYGELYQL